MSTTMVSLFEAKTHLSGLISDMMHSGKEITITRRGQHVAKIVPIRPSEERETLDVIQEIMALRKEIGCHKRLTLKEIQAMKAEGRR